MAITTTESSNPQSVNLSSMSIPQVVELMNREDNRVIEAVHNALPAIGALAQAVQARLAKGGRLVYIGAGTSGRLGVLDAAECPPTFGTDPLQVQAIIAGGRDAIVRAVENAEDSESAGAEGLRKLQLDAGDFVVGISASGTTPFVRGALQYARSLGAGTGSVFCNSGAPLQDDAEFPVCVEVGPEVLRGSTRLKAGTATKMVLNMISTSVMVALGHCIGNLMVDVAANNSKLVRRQAGILAELSGLSEDEAHKLLQKHGNDMRAALKELNIAPQAN